MKIAGQDSCNSKGGTNLRQPSGKHRQATIVQPPKEHFHQGRWSIKGESAVGRTDDEDATMRSNTRGSSEVS